MFDDVKVSFVKSVKVSRIVKTFDIEVDSDEHAFVAKGVGGGVGISHNSAMISLSNLSDERMRYAKSGEWWVESLQRRLANNSAAYTEKPEIGTFLREFLSLYESKSGERGMFNRQSAITHAAKYGRILPDDVGLNPCCFTGDMRLLTENGYKTFEELSLSSSVNIVEPNGTVTKGFVWSSGEKEVVDVIFQNGRKPIRCTADHRFMLNDGSECEAKDLKGKRLKSFAADDGIVDCVIPSGVAEVFDFTEPKTRWGVVEGFVVHNSEILLRPAQFCVAPNTPLITRSGIHKIGDLDNSEVEVWNGEQWSEVKVQQTGKNQKLLRVHFSDGSYLDCTPDHRFSVRKDQESKYREVQAIELNEILEKTKRTLKMEQYQPITEIEGEFVDNTYTIGACFGDGYVVDNLVKIDLYDKKINLPINATYRGQIHTPTNYNVQKQTCTTSIDDNLFNSIRDDIGIIGSWDYQSTIDFFSGWVDADGSETGTGGIRLYGGEEKMRIAQILLSRVGIQSSLCLMQNEGVETNYGKRNVAMWYLQITDARKLNCHRVDVSGGHEPKFKSKWVNVRSVEELDGRYDTFCFNEPIRHKAVFANVLTYQCNLTAACTRPEDDFESLKEKIRLATIIGTIQATQTNFSYLSPIWKENCEEERLLGVSIPGVMDHPVLQNTSDEAKKWLDELSQYVIEVNKEWAKLLNINPAAASRCQKPAGNSGELYNVSSGLHTRFAPYYIRRVRADAKDPLAIVMKQQGFHCEDDITQPGSWVFSFPVKAPEQAVFRDDRTAIEQLEYWLMWRQHWTDHNPSVTIYVKEHEWMEVGNFVWKHFDEICGISFLPHSDHTYMQAPYEEITKEKYEEMLKVTPTFIDYDALQQLETTDHTTSMQEPACSAGGCELI